MNFYHGFLGFFGRLDIFFKKFQYGKTVLSVGKTKQSALILVNDMTRYFDEKNNIFSADRRYRKPVFKIKRRYFLMMWITSYVFFFRVRDFFYLRRKKRYTKEIIYLSVFSSKMNSSRPVSHFVV